MLVVPAVIDGGLLGLLELGGARPAVKAVALTSFEFALGTWVGSMSHDRTTRTLAESEESLI